jgi:hypothetical protein
MITNTIVGIIFSIFAVTLRNVDSLPIMHAMLMGIIVISILLTAGLFAVCNYILKNKLNLE